MGTPTSHYELLDQLGSGAMATVWRAWDQRLERMVAVKIFSSILAGDPGFQEQFERQARQAAGLNHPNVVTIFDFGIDDDNRYLVMELVDGQSLAQRLSEVSVIDTDSTLRIGTSVLAALGEAHRNGIVHRDIKPSNILIGRPSGATTVTDFGTSRAVFDTTGLTHTGLLLGTASYLSPEQGTGEPATPFSDLYATGCVLYECLTGRPPFQGESLALVIDQHEHSIPTPIRQFRPDVSPSVEEAVLRALRKNPDNRYSSADQMCSALLEASIGASPETVTDAERALRTVPTVPLVSARPRAPNRVRWIASAVTALALTVGAAAALLTTSPFSVSAHRAAENPTTTGTTVTGTSEVHGVGTTTVPPPPTQPTTSRPPAVRLAVPPSTSPPANPTTQVSVVSCPTEFASGAGNMPLPSSMPVTLPNGSGLSASDLAVYLATNDQLSVLGPTGWSCQASIGADGSGAIAVAMSSEPSLSDPGGLSASGYPEAISARTTGACQSCAYSAACPFLSLAKTAYPTFANTTSCSIPMGESSALVAQDAADFTDPPMVPGTGNPSGGVNPSNGVVVFHAPNGTGQGDSFTATCTLPSSESSMCTAVLNDFTQRMSETMQGSGTP